MSVSLSFVFSMPSPVYIVGRLGPSHSKVRLRSMNIMMITL